MLTTLYASVCGVDNIGVKSIDFLSTGNSESAY